MKKKDKNKDHKKIKNITITTLKVLGLAGLVVSAMVFPGLAHVVNVVEKEIGNRQRARRSFYNLKSRGLIRVKKYGSGIKIVLTDKGKKRVAKFKFENIKLIKPPIWDKKWRMVMFDIPEFNKVGREQIRRNLYRWGFVKVQKSVFIYPYKCDEAIEAVRDYFKLSDGELYIFETKILEGEKKLLEHFKLN